MRRNLSKKGKIKAAFMVMLFATTFMISFLPEVAVAEVAISIEPKVGYVGYTLRVNGTIETPNGNYTIFFDEEPVKSGTAVDRTVNDTFAVPHRPMGNYTVMLHDVEANENYTAVFTLETKHSIEAVVPPPPKQLQEGNLTEILVKVTGGEAGVVYHPNITVIDPANKTHYNDAPWLPVNSEGYAENHTTYPTDFLPAMTHTNFTGWYDVYLNKTDTEFLDHDRFFIGLTNATEYHRFQVVDIRAANYTRPNEYAWVNITFAGKIVFSENVSAVGGMIERSWPIPGNASMGLYTVNVTSSITNGTVKPVLDTQNFTIVKIPCQIQTRKLNGEVLAGVEVWVYNATMWTVDASLTDEEGWAKFWLEGGNYTFEAKWGEPGNRIPVGTLVNESIRANVTLTLWCWIARLRIAISPPLPFIDMTLTYQDTTEHYVTNSTGIWEIPGDMPTNISYTIEARRYDLLFNTTSMEKLPAAIGVSWVNITITCPTYTMFVHVLDSEESPLQDALVAVYEWSSGVAEPVKSGTTNDWGSVALRCTFGRYKIWVYNQNRTIVLNKTVVDLIEDPLFVVVHCKIFNVDISVVVKDHFGHPIPGALVEVERESLGIPSRKTGSNGAASFYDITGGDCRISVYVMGKFCETISLYLDEARMVVFRLDRYIVVGGYPLEVTQLIACISLGILVALFALALVYRRLRLRKVHEGEGKEKSL